MALVALACVALALTRPRFPRPATAWTWLVLVGTVAATAGLALGAARLEAMRAGALTPPYGVELRVRGVVANPPRVGSDTTRFVVEAPEGRIGVEAPGVVPQLAQGDGVVVAGRARAVEEWEIGLWQQDGAHSVVAADSVRPGGWERGGLRGALDDVRRRARDALGRGADEPAAALLRGFVLGEDDRIAEPVRDDFRRSGLAHVLAVSGQNVMLLALLAVPILSALGLGLRARLLAIVALIAVYVPVAGAGASIQRAGVMGVAGVVAALGSRPRSGWYALGLAAVVTLAVDPRATGDIGWQLSFAAVGGLFAMATPLSRALAPPTAGSRSRPLARLLAEGAAITIAASVATAPLVAHHFGTLSITALPANLLALPAIAPAMWLGMLAGALGQAPGAPVEALTMLGGLCAGYVGWVAHALGPDWAQIEVPVPGLPATAIWTAGLVLAVRLACVQRARRSGLGLRRWPSRTAGAASAFAVLAALAMLASSHSDPRASDLELRFLDVGQGDAILLTPRRGAPVLVDTGPPGAALERLADLGVERLEAIVITHDQLDHSGGLAELIAALEVRRLVTGPGPPPQACRAAPGCPPIHRVTAGDRLRVGSLRLDVLWPATVPPPDADPNLSAVVLHAHRGEFDALLTSDAEAEPGSYRPGPVEVLKVAHHGSADAGLGTLLDLTAPQLAVISVGADNPYGHPAPETVTALGDAGVPVDRTDELGDITIAVRDDGWSVE